MKIKLLSLILTLILLFSFVVVADESINIHKEGENFAVVENEKSANGLKTGARLNLQGIEFHRQSALAGGDLELSLGGGKGSSIEIEKELFEPTKIYEGNGRNRKLKETRNQIIERISIKSVDSEKYLVLKSIEGQYTSPQIPISSLSRQKITIKQNEEGEVEIIIKDKFDNNRQIDFSPSLTGEKYSPIIEDALRSKKGISSIRFIVRPGDVNKNIIILKEVNGKEYKIPETSKEVDKTEKEDNAVEKVLGAIISPFRPLVARLVESNNFKSRTYTFKDLPKEAKLLVSELTKKQGMDRIEEWDYQFKKEGENVQLIATKKTGGSSRTETRTIITDLAKIKNSVDEIRNKIKNLKAEKKRN